MRFAEVAALLATAQDHAFGQPAGSQLRACLLAGWLADRAGLTETERQDCHWAACLRFLGCTGHAHEASVIFGDEIALRSRSLRWDAANPTDVLRELVTHAGEHRGGARRLATVLSVLAGGRSGMAAQFAAGCEVADLFAERLELSPGVRAALSCTFERWNGQGLPNGVKGEAIPRPMRVVVLAQELEVLARVHGAPEARAIAAGRSGKAYDPALVALLDASLDEELARLDGVDPWTAVLERDPEPHRVLSGPALRAALETIADFADLKSPFTVGHSRRVADLASSAGGEGDLVAAGLLHDLGRVAVPNVIWDKPGPLTADERDRVETHALVTWQLLRRCASLGPVASLAASDHERLDGSGYHRAVDAAALSWPARVLATADVYDALVSDRPHRPARSAEQAVAELRAMVDSGALDARAVSAVVEAAGHAPPKLGSWPAGLSDREVEVLRLLTQGLTTRHVASRLAISPKTADRHVQNIYGKVGVSSRGAAAVFAVQHGLMA